LVANFGNSLLEADMTTDTKKDTASIEISADTRPIMLFIKMLESVLQAGNSRINLSDFDSKLVRIEMDSSSTGTGEITVTLYPSDTFLRLAVTLCAGNFNL
jgi:hypothetical protein